MGVWLRAQVSIVTLFIVFYSMPSFAPGESSLSEEWDRTLSLMLEVRTGMTDAPLTASEDQMLERAAATSDRRLQRTVLEILLHTQPSPTRAVNGLLQAFIRGDLPLAEAAPLIEQWTRHPNGRDILIQALGQAEFTRRSSYQMRRFILLADQMRANFTDLFVQAALSQDIPLQAAGYEALRRRIADDEIINLLDNCRRRGR